MNYYKVRVGSPKYHSESTLTYGFDAKLKRGTVVSVPLKNQKVTGVVINAAIKPSFATKNILDVITLTPIPPQLIELITWLRQYYPAPSGQIVSLFLSSILASKSKKTTIQKPSYDATQPLMPLTEAQASALETVRRNRPKSVILHGDTGTGKTRVYLELAKENYSKSLSTIILTPEIGLTTQLASTFRMYFPGRIIVLHSNLSPAKRRDRWHEIISAKESITVIGPRSALFSPVNRLGLIVVDEFHEHAYKQEQSPYYQTTRVAAKLAELHKAQLVMGSATPPISDYYAFSRKKLPIVRMEEQAIASKASTPEIQIIDMKDKNLFGTSPWLSDKMLETIRLALAHKQQSMVFLNRRGTARLVLCKSCGWQAFCSKCDLPLTYHGDSHIMLCHTCGQSTSTPDICRDCGDHNIIFRAIGTKSIVEEMHRLFPDAGIKRFDSDNLRIDRLENQYKSLNDGSVDILVGTQMIGKGLDLPNLSVVGIITAETSLSFPDYTAEERTFQLLNQAIGRINRGHLPGTAIVQTYQPNSLILKNALEKDYQGFYSRQLKERKLYGFPPFRFTLKIVCSRSRSDAARRSSLQVVDKLNTGRLPIEIIGPSPAFTEKTHDKYHWQVIVKAVQRHALVDAIKLLPPNCSYNIDPINLL